MIQKYIHTYIHTFDTNGIFQYSVIFQIHTYIIHTYIIHTYIETLTCIHACIHMMDGAEQEDGVVLVSALLAGPIDTRRSIVVDGKRRRYGGGQPAPLLRPALRGETSAP